MSIHSFPKKILLGVTGSVAAYKSAELVRLLRKAEMEVRVVLTQGGSAFITPMTLQGLSGHVVYQTLMDADAEAAISHIDLARWADLVLIMPCTAHMIAKLAAGLADDLLTTLCLATEAPIMIAPAMNTKMWQHPATQANIECLRQRKVKVLGPGFGAQACGEVGEGCVLEPAEILLKLKAEFKTEGRLNNKKVLITAGPTREEIDPVRYLSNYSSGKMGYAIAKAAQAEGASVTLISGPTALECPAGVNRINVVSAQEMFDAVMSNIQDHSIFIATAAVSDYKIEKRHQQKLKKNAQSLNLTLTLNSDILATVASLPKRPYVVGFAAETENLLENAQTKLQTKKADMIVANLVGEGKGFQTDENELIALTQEKTYSLAHGPKARLAKEFVDLIIELI